MMRLTVLLGAMSVASLSAFGTSLLTNSCAATGSVRFTFSTTQTAVECGDKIFSAFTGTATGDTVTISENTATSYEILLKAPVGGVSAIFSFGYTVQVDTGVCATCVITQIQQTMLTQQATAGGQIPNASTGLNTINNGGVFSPSTSNAITTGGQNALASNLNNISYTVGFTYNPNGTANQPTGLFLNLDDVITQTAVPEPMTFSLMGAGLLGLGLLRKRISRS
jgi:peptidoglycan hydrolase-like protein with peptidoglycan-binding domain